MAHTKRGAELVAGRYRILRELARGGVGAVYEALDKSTGRRVALKRLLENAADQPRTALLFQSEYDTLSRLRHPHIVEVYDYGVDERGPYFTMELLDGQDLSELEPIPYRDACRYLHDVASSLALLHTRRRLHRDLSPRNVRLTSDGRCRLLDFGTMANFGVSDDIVGTPPLVPPEALRGAALDHRSDLYSLGVLAYRVLSGRYPYPARQLEDLQALWREPPARLGEIAAGVPVALDDLVMSLLSLDPAYRPSTTYEVLDRLSVIGGLPPDADPSRTAHGYLVGTRLIGRADAMQSIERRIARAQRSRGAVIVLEGNPGVGKSRLLDEAALVAQLSGALVVRIDVRAHPGQHGAAQALVRALLEAAPRDAREAAIPYRSSLRQVFDGFDKPNGLRSVAPKAEPTRAEVHRALLDWLFDMADHRTLALLVDDLPRIDEGTAALLSALAEGISQQRILLIATCRLVDLRSAPPGVDAIVSRARRLRLHRFSRDETTAVVQSLFGAVPNSELLADWIYDVTTGSPMQIMELARHLVREQSVRFVDGLWVLPPHPPHDRLQHNLAVTLSSRVAALPASERALAEALSVRRGILSLPLCMQLSDDRDPAALFRDLDELEAKGVLVSTGNRRYRFGQEALRQLFLRHLGPQRAKDLHLRLGEALLQHESSRPEDVVEAGYQLILGGAEIRGAELVASAAPRLPFRGGATTAALPALEAALAVYEKHERSPRECLRLAVVICGAMEKRATALYADKTLAALSAYAGGDHARLRRWLGVRPGFWAGQAVTRVKHWLGPASERGMAPKAALFAFYRVAFGALSVRTAMLDIAGTEQLLTYVASFASAGPLPSLIAEVFRAQVLALRGDYAGSQRCARAVLERFAAEPMLARLAGRATTSGILATLHIGIGMLEAHYGLHSAAVEAISDELSSLAQRAHAEEPVAGGRETGAVSEVELRLAADRLRLAMHLARGERIQAEAMYEPVRGSVALGMHRLFEVWCTVLECNMSLRSADVAGLRRCVETFSHYIDEHAHVAVWLDIARAHLALCLGKPEEALAGYAKCLEQVPPGSASCWDTLCFGYADALLATGEYVQARTWLLALLEHPVVVAAERTSSWATLEATLAWAEAECQALDAAQQRIQALERELEDSDHRLVIGFMHEVAARIAKRAGEEASCTSHLNKMRRSYALTRNQALMKRGQRVQDSLRVVKPGESKLRAVNERSDREVVTRVTTRREISSQPASATIPLAVQEQAPALEALETLLAGSGASEGYLYALQHGQPQLLAATEYEHVAELSERVRELSEEALSAASEPPEEPADSEARQSYVHVRTPDRSYQLHWLYDAETRDRVAACLLSAGSAELRAPNAELLAQAAGRLQLVPLK